MIVCVLRFKLWISSVMVMMVVSEVGMVLVRCGSK